MWSFSYAAETDVAPSAVWRLWSDVASWNQWNPDVRTALLDGEFAEGSGIRMTLLSGEVIGLTLAEVDAGSSFVDVATVDGVVVRTVHRIDAGETKRHRVSYELSVSGPVPEQVLAKIGTAISADLPETVAALLNAAAA